jgi:hypothetical protein
MNVIHVKLSQDLPTKAQNKLRYAIELGIWREAWREAEATNDYQWMDYLQRSYERVGLP